MFALINGLLSAWLCELKQRGERKAESEERTKLSCYYSLFFFLFLSVCSNDTTHSRQAIHLENHSYTMSSLSHVTISWYFIHYTAYYEIGQIKFVIKLLAPSDIKLQFFEKRWGAVGGWVFLWVSWLTISTIPLPVTSNYPWLRYRRSSPLFLSLPPTELGL